MVNRIWIKRHFSFKSPFRYLLEIRVSITSCNVYVINSCENSCVISKEFCIWSNTFWKIIDVNKKRRGPKIDPWATPAVILAHLDDWPFRRTLWYQSLKKHSIRCKRLPEIPIDSSIYKPLCQIEICKNTALVWRVGLQSNVEKISVISINWYMH